MCVLMKILCRSIGTTMRKILRDASSQQIQPKQIQKQHHCFKKKRRRNGFLIKKRRRDWTFARLGF